MDFSGVSYEEAMRRAREIVPTLRERAQKCEDARVLLPENEKLLHDSGLFRYHQPRRFGGMELPFIAYFDVPELLAQGDMSTAWVVSNLGSHHRNLVWWPAQAQEEVWATGPDTVVSVVLAPTCTVEKVDGGVPAAVRAGARGQDS